MEIQYDNDSTSTPRAMWKNPDPPIIFSIPSIPPQPCASLMQPASNKLGSANPPTTK
jgi:hypothetical protein